MIETKKRTILLIEDEISLLEVVKKKLEANNFEVITSRSVERAFSPKFKEDAKGDVTLSGVELVLKYLEDLEQIDAIWLDHNLIGEDDGLDFVSKFKSNDGKWSKIPIFVVSNTSDADLVKTYKILGVNNYFIKAEHRLDEIINKIILSLNKAEK